MSKIKFITDSSCDLMPEQIAKNDIDIVPYLASLNGETYYREHADITVKEFYRRLRAEDAYPKTSLPPIQDYINIFKRNLDLGYEIVCFCLTTKFSASYSSAINAVNILKEDYPGASITVVDSWQASAGQGMMILEACKMREAGYTTAQIVEKLEILKAHVCIYLVVDSLIYLQKGGRIGKTSALLGGLLNIKPVIAMKNGELLPYSKVRGRKNGEKEVIRLLNKDIADKKDDYTVFVLSTDLPEEADAMEEELTKNHGYNIEGKYTIGVTIGAHLGPTAIAAGYMRRFDTL